MALYTVRYFDSCRLFSTTSIVMKKIRKVPPKNFKDVYLKGTAAFIQRQLSDPYVKKRRIENYRCRSAFKLLEIDDKFKFLQHAKTVLDLGASPGSWSQVARDRIENHGVVLAVDLAHFPLLEGVHFIQGDFTSDAVQKKIHNLLKEHSSLGKVDVVLCDAAPKASGIKLVDQDAIIVIAKSAISVALKHLKQDGILLFKLFRGSNSTRLVKTVQQYFDQVKQLKPDASRKESSEYYVLCLKYRKPYS